MAQYQILDADGIPALSGKDSLYFDDGQWQMPGEPGHDPAPLAAFLAGKPGHKANCMGRSPAAVNPSDIAAKEAEKAALEQAIADRLAFQRDPEAFQTAKRIEAINAAHDAEKAKAQELGVSADTLAGIEELRAAELAKS